MGYHYLSYQWNIIFLGWIYIYMHAIRCWASGRVLNHSKSMWDVWHSFDGEFLLSFFVKNQGISHQFCPVGVSHRCWFFCFAFWVLEKPLDQHRYGLGFQQRSRKESHLAATKTPWLGDGYGWLPLYGLGKIMKNHIIHMLLLYAFISISAGNFMNYANFCW